MSIASERFSEKVGVFNYAFESGIDYVVSNIARLIRSTGHVDVGGDVRIIKIEVVRPPDKYERELRLIIVQPDDIERYFQGPLILFEGCKNSKELVLRSLGYKDKYDKDKEKE